MVFCFNFNFVAWYMEAQFPLVRTQSMLNIYCIIKLLKVWHIARNIKVFYKYQQGLIIN